MGRDLEMELVMGHVEREKRQSRRNGDCICFSNLFFFFSSELCSSILFCWIPSSMQSTIAPHYFLCQAEDDAGAPSERMLLLPLPLRFTASWAEVLALACLEFHGEMLRVTIRKEKE